MADLQFNLDITYSLKIEQIEAIHKLLKKEDVLLLLPTGYGKSLVFFLFPLIMDSLHPGKSHQSLVVTPLKSLMRNLQMEYTEKGFSVGCWLPDSTLEEIEGIKAGKYATVLVTPETLSQATTIKPAFDVYGEKLCLVCIDEAHCVIEWREFRKSYQDIGELRAKLKPPFIVATATLTSTCKEQLITALHMNREKLNVVARLPDRPNIFLEYRERPVSRDVVPERLRWYFQELATNGIKTRKTLIYCRSFTISGEIYLQALTYLKEMAFKDGVRTMRNKLVSQFHSETYDTDQRRILEEFLKANSTIRCIICTVAFGMGVNISDIELVIHWGEPNSVLAYAQEIGRAGRNGKPAKAIMFHSGQQLANADDGMKLIVKKSKEGYCIRKEVLEALFHEGMEPLAPPVSCGQSGQCSYCQCGRCTCCYSCRRKCDCHSESLEGDV